MACHRTPRYHPAPTPRHRRKVTLPTDPATGFVFTDVQNDAACTCPSPGMRFAICPRHGADVYADQYARHATDSLGPINPVGSAGFGGPR